MAYVQVVTDHLLVCNSIMLFAGLHRRKNKAARVLLYPRAWSREPQGEQGTGEEDLDSQLEMTQRLLRLAARTYGVQLRPVEAMSQTSDGRVH